MLLMAPTKRCSDCGGNYGLEFFRNTSYYSTNKLSKCKTCTSGRANGVIGVIPPKPLIAKCPVCLEIFPHQLLVIDHYHDYFWKISSGGQHMYYGEFRAWLCSPCNTRVGYFESQTYVFRQAREFASKDYRVSVQNTMDDLANRSSAVSKKLKKN